MENPNPREFQREQEIKYLLQGPDDYQKLAGPGGLSGLLGREHQENFYFDTPSLHLADHLTMLRIRTTSSGPARLTLKSGTEVEAGYFRSTEIEAVLSREVLKRVHREPGFLYHLDLKPVKELRARFGELPLVLVGELLNERCRFQSGGFLIELDRMTFPDGTQEFEVEVETRDPGLARAWLLEEFQRLGIRPEPGRQTKFERLVRKIKLPGQGRTESINS